MKKILIPLIILLFTGTSSFASQYHSMGRNAYVYRNYAKAREMFLKDVEATGNGDSYYFLGEIAKIEKNYDEAINYFSIAVNKNMTRKFLVNAYWNLVILYEERGDYPNYIKYCRELWFRTGDSSAKNKIDTLINKLLWSNSDDAVNKFNEGVELSKKGDRKNAVQCFRDAINTDSNFLAPRFELGMIAYNDGNMSEAMYNLSPIGERIPFYAEVQLILGNINFRSRNYSSAINNFTSVLDYGFIDKSARHDTILKRGTCYYNTGDYDDAEKDISSAADAVKNDNEPLILLSAIYIKKKDFNSALEILRKAESIPGNKAVVLFQTGSIYYYKNDPKYADYFERLHNETKDNKEEYSRYIKAFKLLMNYYYANKEYQKSAEVSERIQSCINDYDAILTSARSFHHLGRHEEAVSMFKKISISSSSDRLLLAISYAATGRKQNAVEMLQLLMNDRQVLNEAKKDKNLRAYIEEIEQAKAAELRRKEQSNTVNKTQLNQNDNIKQ